MNRPWIGDGRKRLFRRRPLILGGFCEEGLFLVQTNGESGILKLHAFKMTALQGSPQKQMSGLAVRLLQNRFRRTADKSVAEISEELAKLSFGPLLLY